MSFENPSSEVWGNLIHHRSNIDDCSFGRSRDYQGRVMKAGWLCFDRECYSVMRNRLVKKKIKNKIELANDRPWYRIPTLTVGNFTIQSGNASDYFTHLLKWRQAGYSLIFIHRLQYFVILLNVNNTFCHIPLELIFSTFLIVIFIVNPVSTNLLSICSAWRETSYSGAEAAIIITVITII